LWETNSTPGTFPFGNRPKMIDTIQMALFLDVASGERSEYYNLGSLVERYGVKKERAHRSDADTRMTKDVLLAQLKIAKKAFA
jgi:DNA polymerase III alpha subunit (gram-positive type)